MIALMMLAAVAQAPPISPPAPPPPPTVMGPAIANPTPAARAAGVEVARLLNSEALTLGQSRKLFDESMPKVLGADPNFRIAETAYPGVTAAVITAMRPIVEKAAIARLPDLWTRLGAVYSGAFTEAELGSLLTFYRSPTGEWMIKQVMEGTDMTNLLAKGVADPDAKIEGKDLTEAVTKPGIARIAGSMTPDRARELMRFSTGPIGRKLVPLNPILLKTAADWANAPSPEFDKQVEGTVVTAMKDFMAKQDAARGQSKK